MTLPGKTQYCDNLPAETINSKWQGERLERSQITGIPVKPNPNEQDPSIE
ncbi:MAG: hypothetical protein ACI8Y4_001085 [Candidatus Poriferisodalaceae bacterium]|jgi:hypothetical protein